MEMEHGIKKQGLTKNFKCLECEKEYVKSRDLQEHTIAEHTDITFRCEFCNQEFKRGSTLQRHINKRHYQLAFKYDERLKEGKSLLKHINAENLPMDVLQEEDLKAVMLYMEYRDKMKNIY